MAALQRCGVPKRLTRAFFRRSVHEVAPDLIGATLLVNGVGGRLVEVEAGRDAEVVFADIKGLIAG